MLFKCGFGMQFIYLFCQYDRRVNWLSLKETLVISQYHVMCSSSDRGNSRSLFVLSVVVIGNFRALPGLVPASGFPCCSSVQKPLCPKMWPSALLEVQTQRHLVCLIQNIISQIKLILHRYTTEKSCVLDTEYYIANQRYCNLHR